MHQVNAKVIVKITPQEMLDRIRKEGGAIVLKHALGMSTALYQVYPVGPPHKDGTPHTRDTFAIVETSGNSISDANQKAGKVLASNGHFETSNQKWQFMPGKKLSFIAAGASFFLEFGTIYMEAQPLIRQFMKKARQDIIKELRELNKTLKSR
jgi:hypothetical protein